MAGILDYIEWRGDVSFEVSPFNEVDALILCQIEYNKLDGFVEKEISKKGITMKELSDNFIKLSESSKTKDLGASINPLTIELLQRSGQTERFGSIMLSGYVDILDLEKDEQFSAITYSYNGKKQKWNCVVYRGTDDTLVGWKEDFNLSYKEIPAQKDALKYLQNAMENLTGDFMLAGHSKGGNLSIYSAVNLDSKQQKRITHIYNNDGPGFTKDFFETDKYKAIQHKEHTFVPQDSLVGMLMYHADGYVTIESTESTGILQHDPFTWKVKSKHFVELEDVSGQSKFIGDTIRDWLYSVSVEQRELFVETVFSIVENTKATTNSELASNKLENAVKMLHATKNLNSDTKDAVLKILQLLLKFGWSNRDTLIGKR